MIDQNESNTKETEVKMRQPDSFAYLSEEEKMQLI